MSLQHPELDADNTILTFPDSYLEFDDSFDPTSDDEYDDTDLELQHHMQYWQICHDEESRPSSMPDLIPITPDPSPTVSPLHPLMATYLGQSFSSGFSSDEEDYADVYHPNDDINNNDQMAPNYELARQWGIQYQWPQPVCEGCNLIHPVGIIEQDN